MKKISKVISILVLTIVVAISILFLHKQEKILTNKKENKSSFISMMVEQEDGSYKENTNINFVNVGYLFNPEKSGCENGGTLSWNKEKDKVEASLLTSDKCYAYFDIYNLEKYCAYTKEDSLVCDIVRKKDNTIIYHDDRSDYEGEENVNLEVDDLSYRYTGASKDVDNYICFGSDVSSCPADNLYRIIGLFKNSDGKYETKLIKADYANKNLLGNGSTKPRETPDYSANGSFYSGVYSKTSGSNEEKDAYTHRYRGSRTEVNRYRWQENGIQETIVDWPTALLNTIHLNHNFLNTFSKEWQDKIIDYKWTYKGSTWGNIAVGSKTSSNTIRTTYDYEVGKNANKTLTEPIKIGLMYVNDYLYAASPNNWNLKPYNGISSYQSGNPDSEGNPQGTYDGTDGTDYRFAIDENWMYMGLWEWTITQRTDASSIQAFSVRAPGYVNAVLSVGVDALAVRPCFYLTSDAQIKSGDGSKDSPYQISVE